MSKYINKDEVLAEMGKLFFSEEMQTFRLDNGFYGQRDYIINYVRNLPTVENKSMQVELEGDGYADGELVYDYGKCPNCGWEFKEDDKDWQEPYCCHCGQKLHWFENTESEDRNDNIY